MSSDDDHINAVAAMVDKLERAGVDPIMLAEVGAVVLLGLKAKLDMAGTDPVKLKKLSIELGCHARLLGAVSSLV